MRQGCLMTFRNLAQRVVPHRIDFEMSRIGSGRVQSLPQRFGNLRLYIGLRWRPSILMADTPILMSSGSISKTFRLVGSSSA